MGSTADDILHRLNPQATVERLNGEAKAALAANDKGAAIEAFEKLLKFMPDHPDILSNLAALYFQTGNPSLALERAEKAFEVAPENPGVKQNYLNIKAAVSVSDNQAADPLNAARALREALRQKPSDPVLRIELSNMLELAGAPGVLSDYLPDLPPERLGTHLLIACMPKSGSSLLKESLSALTGWDTLFLSYAYLQNEQEIYLPTLLEAAEKDTITQQHCRATGPNIQILQAFGIRPIVLTRNLEDIVLSLSDFYDSGAVINTFFGDVWPTLDQTGKHDLIIDHVIPWYAVFGASWERASRRGQLDCLFVSYEEMIADKPGTLLRISEFLDLGKDAQSCIDAIAAAEGDTDRTRFNKGVAGRGEQALTKEQITRIKRLEGAYAPKAAEDAA